jgi:hypothetical protein
MNYRGRDFKLIMKAQTATGQAIINGKRIAIDCREYRNAVVNISTSSSAACTIKCKGSIGDTPLSNYANAQSVTNNWDYLELADLSDSSNPLRGSTGLVLTGTDCSKNFEINVNSIDFFTFDMTAHTAGAVTIKVTLTNNA